MAAPENRKLRNSMYNYHYPSSSLFCDNRYSSNYRNVNISNNETFPTIQQSETISICSRSFASRTRKYLPVEFPISFPENNGVLWSNRSEVLLLLAETHIFLSIFLYSERQLSFRTSPISGTFSSNQYFKCSFLIEYIPDVNTIFWYIS